MRTPVCCGGTLLFADVSFHPGLVMLLPSFSLRSLLLWTAVCGVYFAAISRALVGDVWARTLVIATTALVLTFLVYALVFWIAWLVSLVVRPLKSAWRDDASVTGAPFAANRLPPQEVPPEDLW